MSKLPDKYKAIPKPYIGQPKKPYGDQWSTFRDVSNPQDVGTDREPGDAIAPERPTGAESTDGQFVQKKPKSIRWRRKDSNE